jgi:hypothetical protein
MLAMRVSNVGLALVSALAAAALLEAGARLAYEPPWFATLAQTTRDGDFSAYRRNTDALRDRDYGAKSTRVRGVLILGDSVTYGAGVPDEAAPFPRVLAKRLDVEVLNVESQVRRRGTGFGSGTARAGASTRRRTDRVLPSRRQQCFVAGDVRPDT